MDVDAPQRIRKHVATERKRAFQVTKAIAAAEDQQAGVVAKYQDKCALCRKAMDLFISVSGAACKDYAWRTQINFFTAKKRTSRQPSS